MNFSPRGQTQSLRTGKVAVIGAIARKGMVVAKVIENSDTRTLDSFVRSTVADDVSLVATDEHSGYRLLDKDYNHESVRHNAGQYVRGNMHTSNIDSFWSLLKRGIMERCQERCQASL